MNTLKIAGVLFAGASLAAIVGGIFWWRRRTKDGERPPIIPTRPPRKPEATDREDLEPDERPSRADTTLPVGHYVRHEDLHPELTKVLNSLFEDGWPPDEETINELERDDVIVFAAESEPTGNYTETRQELISAKVLSVEKSMVRGRVFGEVKHAEHHGAHAGHGVRIGDLVEIPRSKVLVAARREDQNPAGYGSQGEAAATLKPSDSTKQTYRVRPGTPYDLVLPYRTEDLKWYLDRELVKVEHLGGKGLLEQILFSEDSLRGEVSLRAIDEDPEVGAVFVARWDLAIES